MSFGLTFRQLHLSRLCSLFGFWFQKSCSNWAFILGVKLGKEENNKQLTTRLISDYRHHFLWYKNIQRTLQPCHFPLQINKVPHIMHRLLFRSWTLNPPLAQPWHNCGSAINLNLSPCQIRNTLWFSGFPGTVCPILTGKTVYIYECKIDRKNRRNRIERKITSSNLIIIIPQWGLWLSWSGSGTKFLVKHVFINRN